MSYWTGTHWVAEGPAAKPPPRPSRTSHVLGALAEGALLSLLVVGLVSGTAFAAKGGGGKGNGNVTAPSGGCLVDGTVVTGTGLPTDEVLNFFVTDTAGQHGWVLGFTDSGTWAVTVPARSGTTTYEFGSKTWGPNGTKYTVFASCSVG
jgi:hypothetical protein